MFDFDISESTNLEIFKRVELIFYSKSKPIRNKIVENIENFKRHCKIYNENFSLETYFNKHYYLENYNKDFPNINPSTKTIKHDK